MRLFRILTFKELKSYFLTPFGWLVLAFITTMQGISLSMAMKSFRDAPRQESLLYAMFHSPLFWFYFLFIFPLITMRLFAEEERSGTLETLLTAPVKTSHVVFSKYAAAMLFYSTLWIPVLIQLAVFRIVSDLPPAWSSGALFGSMAVMLLMGAAYTAVGCLASALTSSQIIAGIFTLGILVIQFFLGFVTSLWGESFAGAGFFQYISCQQHLHYFVSGLLDTKTAVYYLSMAAFVLFVTYHVVDFRRWKQ